VGEHAKLTPAYRETATRLRSKSCGWAPTDETTLIPRREIVVPLFDSNKIFDHRKMEGK
jgi:hypothetical protein